MSDQASSNNGSLWDDHDAQIFDGADEFSNSSVHANPDQQIMLCQPVAAPADDIFSTAGGRTSPEPTVLPLQLWFNSEASKVSSQNHTLGSTAHLSNTRASTLRKLTVGFALGKLLEHLRASVSSYTQDELLNLCSIDNFNVHILPGGASDESWEIAGAGMVSPPMSLKVTLRDFDSTNFFASGNEGDNWGRDVETVITRHSPFCCAKQAVKDEAQNDGNMCCVFGVILRFIFSGECLEGGNNSELSSNPQEVQGCVGDFLRSLSIPPEDMNLGSNKRRASHQHQENFNFYHVISQLVKDLLDFVPNNCITLDSAINDIHRLLQEPARFLFESNHQLATATKMYGRSVEAKAILDAFCRVNSTRQSEVFMIKGYSGSGKSRLVHSVSESVYAANGLMVSTKFEDGSSNQLSLALSAFDDLCIMLAESLSVSEGGPAHLWYELNSQFGTNFHMLVSTLPSVVRLAPSPIAAFSLANNRVESGGDVNFFSLCDIIKRFMRAVATTSRPVMIFWDDMQWCDAVSLGLIHAVLSDNRGGNSFIFFAGSYRDNEVDDEHILQGFFSWLYSFHVPVNTVSLGGLSDVDVLELVSHSLGMLPRLCDSLSQVVHRKTEGNPFFVQTFLRSLVDKRMLVYSFREKSWVWDMNEICEENIMPNVVELLSEKLGNLSEDSQNALKVAACFGIKIGMTTARSLSKTHQYSFLVVALNNVVEDGLMDLSSDTNGSSYRFVHDKVREAAYDMIRQDERNRYHFDIGMALLESQSNEKPADLLMILKQVNFGVPSLLPDGSKRLSIAELNYGAASEMVNSSNFTSAYHLAKTAVMLLPDECWTRQYALSLKFYFLLSKAAHSYRKIDEAKDALNEIIEHSTSISTKLDAYALQHSMLFKSCDLNEFGELFVTIAAVLRSLGEIISEGEINIQATSTQVRMAIFALENESDDDLLHANQYKRSPQQQVDIMKAYSILVNLAYVAKPSLFPYLAARWAQFSFRFKVACKFTPAAYVTLAIVLCQDICNDNISLGHRIGKLGLRLMHDAYLSELPSIYFSYYAHIGILFEPLQACIDMHRKAYEHSIQVGNITVATMHKQFLIVRLLHAGMNLQELRDEIQHELMMAEQYFPMLRLKLNVYYKAVLTLIGDESYQDHPTKSNESVFDQNPAFVLSGMVTMTYLGYHERVKHMGKSWESLRGKNELAAIVFRGIYVSFYYALSCICLQRKKNLKKKRAPEEIKHSLDVLKKAAEYSKWNFANKLALVLAERYSLTENKDAENQYAVAITRSKLSHFVHEEGLACELAGEHHKRKGNIEKSLHLFKQAEECYERWGSTVKTRQMAEKINKLRS